MANEKLIVTTSDGTAIPVVMAPPGHGAGVSAIFPNLLSWQESQAVLDPMAEPRTFDTIAANVSTTLFLKEGDVPTAEQVLRATMHFSPEQVFVGELSDDPQRTAEFLASVEAQCNKSE